MSQVKLPVLTQADIDIIKDVIARERNRRGNTSQRPAQQHVPPMAPEVYVVKTPPSGIFGLFTDTPVSALCDVYRFTESSLTSINKVIEVYNLCSVDAPGDAFGLAIRDKFGKWYLQSICTPLPPPDIGTGSPESCGICETVRVTYCVSVSGLSNNNCTFCSVFGAEHILLSQPGGFQNCQWSGDGTSVCSGSTAPGESDSIVLDIFAGGATVYVWFNDALAAVYDVLDTNWNCITSTELTLRYTTDVADYACSNWPTTLTLYPIECPGGTGTGTGCTPGWFDQFTDADSTDLMVHVPDLSPCFALYSADFGTWDIQSGGAEPTLFSSSPTQAAFVFDPLLDAYSLTVDLVWPTTVVDDLNSITFFIRVNGASFPVFVQLSHIVLNSWLLTVSDGTSTDSNAVTLVATTPYTLTVNVTPTTVDADINSVTSNISSTVQASFTPIRVKVQSTNQVVGCVFLDNLSVF